jgi:predicted transcriptional regulator
LLVFSILLRKIGRGLSITRIMYITYLSYTQGREYLRELVENSMLFYDIDSKRFIITEKGHRFLYLVEELEKMLGFGRNSSEIIER